MLMPFAALTAAAAAAAAGLSAGETFAEDLVVRPLPDGKVLLHFEFDIGRAQPPDGADQHNYHLFPRQIGEIVQGYGVSALQLTFTQGVWREAHWGYPPAASHGTGAEVIAQIDDVGQETGSRWKGLTNALSGVFCASLNFIGDENTAMPRLAFAEARQGSTSNGTVRHAYLARENVCTENLTPWVKQLPCQSMSGIGALLNPHRLYNMHFHSMGATLRSVPSSGGGRQLHYKQHLSVVLDPAAFGLGDEWTLDELMDRHLATACPAATRSTVRIVAPDTGVQVTPAPDSVSRNDGTGHTTHVYDMQKRQGHGARIGIAFRPDVGGRVPAAEAPVVAAHRYVTGHGNSDGGVETIITSRHNEPMQITLLDTLPWYLRVYSHTLQIHTTAADGRTLELTPSQTAFTPAVDRGRPASFELKLELPPNSRTAVRYDFDKGFLKYTEHPPDANRGFNIGPAIVSYRLARTATRPLFCADSEECPVWVYTELFLASLPTPDFSMPYNVITFTCTILALFFGRMFNLLTRDFAVLKPAAPSSS